MATGGLLRASSGSIDGTTQQQLPTGESGHSAQHLIHERLLLEARRLLAYSDLDVTTISYSLGFKDPAYFSRFFTRREAMSPSAFRRRHSFDAAA